LLFGVTYRYIMSSDENPQLKAGGVLAFGLVRGLTQIDVGLCCYSTILPFVVLGAESVVWFAMSAILFQSHFVNALDTAIKLGWVKPFKST
jgi:predicted metal-binding membrane protein